MVMLAIDTRIDDRIGASTCSAMRVGVGRHCLDMGACFAASAAGLWLDGTRAMLAMQATCGGQSISQIVGYHLMFMPMTCLGMLIASIVCFRPAPMCWASLRSPLAFIEWARSALLGFVAMMLAMAIEMMTARDLLNGIGDARLPLAASCALSGGIVLCIARSIDRLHDTEPQSRAQA